MTRRVVLATKNPHKVPEMEAILRQKMPQLQIVHGLEWPDVDEIGVTIEQNALLKARAVCAATGIAAIGDDTGLEVDALGGAPGVRAARYAGPNATYRDNRVALLLALEGVVDRTARFRTAVAYVTPDGHEIVGEGSLEGRITTAERGEEGFGYDRIFEVAEGRTLAEIGAAEKNLLSHRARALADLADRLAEVELL